MFQKVETIVADTVLRGIEDWRKDLQIARDFRLHLGFRPTGGGGNNFNRAEIKEFLMQNEISVR